MDTINRLSINAEATEQSIIDFIRTHVTAAGFSRAVIGLSGGIDSALSAYLAVRALGPANVLAVRMPSLTSNLDSLTDAQLVIDALGIESVTIPITPYIQPMFIQFPDMSDARRGNVMARMRMIILYDQSVAFNGLVMGTSNRTETLLGYFTIHGDGAAALQPIGALYKTQVRQLAEHMGIPRSIIDKPPSADLWPGQTDEGEIGYTYDEIDQVLYLLTDNGLTFGEAVARGFPRDMVDNIWQRLLDTQYKRTMSPVANRPVS